MIKLESGKSLFLINLIGTVYFSLLILHSYFNINTQFTSFINEIFTTLFLLSGIVVIVYTIKTFKKDQYKLKSFSFWAIFLISLNILILAIATIFNI